MTEDRAGTSAEAPSSDEQREPSLLTLDDLFHALRPRRPRRPAP